MGVAAVYTPKDFELNRIMLDIVALADHRPPKARHRRIGSCASHYRIAETLPGQLRFIRQRSGYPTPGEMTFHIGAKPGDIAETVLLPGDPYRARWAAQTFLKDAVLVNEVRGMLGYTGTWNGHRVTIHGSGMGMPSLSIYANELIRDYGAKTLIRIGSAGALPDHVKVRDVILAQTASTVGSPSRTIFQELNFAPCADFGLLSEAYTAASAKGTPVHVGGIYSSDTFYDERPDLSERAYPPRLPWRRDGGGRALHGRRPPQGPRAGGPDRL